jgi:hypothetical protein
VALELAGIALEKLIKVEVRERARFARHFVPGASGELAQNLGRPSVVVAFQGIFFGAEAAGKLKELRGKYLAREPVDFLCETVGEGYFTQVLIEGLHVVQRAGFLEQFDYVCEVAEYVPPPPPAVANPLGGIDTSLLDEAAGAMDDIQDAIGQVSELASLIGGAADYGNPTTRLPSMLTTFTDAAGGAATTLSSIAELL